MRGCLESAPIDARAAWTGARQALMLARMLRLLTRFLGQLLLAGGFIALIVDGTRSIAGGYLLVTSLGKGLSETFPALYQSLQKGIEANSAFLWDPVLATLLLLPVSMALGGLGALLIVFSHKQAATNRYWRR
jgi:hypothetical protein